MYTGWSSCLLGWVSMLMFFAIGLIQNTYLHHCCLTVYGVSIVTSTGSRTRTSNCGFVLVVSWLRQFFKGVKFKCSCSSLTIAEKRLRRYPTGGSPCNEAPNCWCIYLRILLWLFVVRLRGWPGAFFGGLQLRKLLVFATKSIVVAARKVIVMSKTADPPVVAEALGVLVPIALFEKCAIWFRFLGFNNGPDLYNVRLDLYWNESEIKTQTAIISILSRTTSIYWPKIQCKRTAFVIKIQLIYYHLRFLNAPLYKVRPGTRCVQKCKARTNCLTAHLPAQNHTNLSMKYNIQNSINCSLLVWYTPHRNRFPTTAWSS